MGEGNATLRKMIAVGHGGGQSVSQRFAAELSVTLGKVFRDLFDVPARIENEELSETKRDGVLAAVPEPGLHIAVSAPGGEVGLIGLDALLVNAIVELATGADERSVFREARSPTRIDAALCREFAERLAGAFPEQIALAEGFAALPPLAVLRHEQDPGRLVYTMADTVYRRFTGEIGLQGGIRGGRFDFSIPKALWRDQTRPHSDEESRDWRRRLQQNVLTAPITLRAELEAIPFTLGAALGLTPGDVVALDPMALSDLRLTTDRGAVLFSGRLGEMNGRKAVRLSSGESEDGEMPVAEAGLSGALVGAAGVSELAAPMDAAGLGDMPGLGDAAGLGDMPGLGDAAGLDDMPGLGDAAELGDMPGLGDATGLDDMPGLGDMPAPALAPDFDSQSTPPPFAMAVAADEDLAPPTPADPPP